MFNFLADALDTLEQVGALKYTISQPGQMKLTQEADTTSDLLDLFQRDWAKLTAGVYKVDYAKSKSDNKSNLCFRVNKAPEQSAAVAGIGAAVGDIGQVLNLQQQIWQLQAASQLRDLEDKHRQEMEGLKAKLAKQDQGDGIGLDSISGIVAGLDKVQNIMLMAQGKAPLSSVSAAVAGATPTTTAPAGQFDQEATARLGDALESLVADLGDEAVLGALETLAAKAKANPEKVKNSLGYLSML